MAQGQPVGIVRDPPKMGGGWAGWMGGDWMRPMYATGFAGYKSETEGGTPLSAAIFRPRDNPAPAMSENVSPINLMINVTGNYVRDDRDIEVMTDRMIKKIEEKLGRRGALFGFAVVR
jgi:hypothetical protein